MKKTLLAVLAVFCIISVSEAEVAVKTKQGNIFHWAYYFERDNSYCTTKKGLGDFCVDKAGVVSIIEDDKEKLPQEQKVEKGYIKIDCAQDAFCYNEKKALLEAQKAEAAGITNTQSSSGGGSHMGGGGYKPLDGYIYTPPTEEQKKMSGSTTKGIK